nr:hypothetical protein [Armatimonadota bacterium]
SSGRMTVGVEVRASDATFWPAVDAGGREGGWRPQTETHFLQPPEAQEGGGGADLATVATVIGGNGALGAADCRSHPVLVQMDGGAVRAWEEALPERSAPIAVAVVPGPARVGAVSLLSGQIESRRDKAALMIRGGRSFPALGRMAEIPMTRARLVSDEGFAAERAHLSAVSHVPVADVVLIGVYPQVPLAAVGQLAVVDEGRVLRIWLKPSALGPKPLAASKLVTVIFGRQRSTGKSLQAVMTHR